MVVALLASIGSSRTRLSRRSSARSRADVGGCDTDVDDVQGVAEADDRSPTMLDAVDEVLDAEEVVGAGGSDVGDGFLEPSGRR